MLRDRRRKGQLNYHSVWRLALQHSQYWSLVSTGHADDTAWFPMHSVKPTCQCHSKSEKKQLRQRHGKKTPFNIQIKQPCCAYKEGGTDMQNAYSHRHSDHFILNTEHSILLADLICKHWGYPTGAVLTHSAIGSHSVKCLILVHNVSTNVTFHGGKLSHGSRSLDLRRTSRLFIDRPSDWFHDVTSRLQPDLNLHCTCPRAQ